MMERAARWWLTAILVFLPFQQRIVMTGFFPSTVSALLQYLDEATIVFFFPWALAALLREKRPVSRLLFPPAFMIVLFCAVSIVSGIVNRNPPLATLLGTFDYVKNFVVIGIYAVFFRKLDGLRKIFRVLLLVAVILGSFAALQELWALTHRYLFRLDIHDPANYLLGIPPVAQWRLGMYRAASLVHHSNSLGFYSLLLLTIYCFTQRVVKPVHVLALFSGIVFSVSRMAYAGFLFLGTIQLFMRRRWVIVPMVPVLALVILMSRLPESRDTFLSRKKTGASAGTAVQAEPRAYPVFFRGYARAKAWEIWKDHVFLGRGPGMFGGVVSLVLHSSVYEEYHFSKKWYSFMLSFRSLDQFWPQALAETGAIGSALFAGLLCALAAVFVRCARRARETALRGYFTGFFVAMIFVAALTMGSGFNNAMFMFTYFALAGMALGSYENTPGQ